MKTVILALTLIFSAGVNATTCEAVTKAVETNEDYLWSLKLNSKKVSEEFYAKAYKNYEESVKIKAKICKK